MISLLIIGLIACACAVPYSFDRSQYPHRRPSDEYHQSHRAPCQNNLQQFDNIVNKFWNDFDKRMKDLDNKLTVWTDFDKRIKDLDNKLTVWTNFDKRMKDLDNKLNVWTDFDKRMKDLDNKLSIWTDFDKKVKTLDNKLTELQLHYPSSVSEKGVAGNEYIITIPLSGFEKTDINVTAREGIVIIEANQKNSAGNENIYSNFRTLPATVKLDGKWTYEGGVLKIIFPLKEGVETQTVESMGVITTDLTTPSPTTHREDVEQKHVEGSVNDQDADPTIEQNSDDEEEIYDIDIRSGVEAASHLTNEVKLVPVKY